MGELNFLDGHVHIVAGGVLQSDGLEGSQQKHSHYSLFRLPRLQYRRQPEEGSQAYQARESLLWDRGGSQRDQGTPYVSQIAEVEHYHAQGQAECRLLLIL